MSIVLNFEVIESSQVGELRRRVQVIAEDAGFSAETSAKAALAATELGTNLVKHTGQKGGCVLVQVVTVDGRSALQLTSIDDGPGVENLSSALRDGFSTASTSGTGLGALRRMATAFDIFSAPGKGTAVFAEISESPAAPVLSGGIGINCPGETVCGDGWTILRGRLGRTLMVIDGLGHGDAAATVSDQAREVFNEVHEQPLERIFTAIHTKLRGTRGGAVSIVKIPDSGETVGYMGIGNIAGFIHAAGKSTHMVSMSGIVGSEMRRAREFQYPFPKGASMILHSDGLTTRTSVSEYLGITRRHPALVAAVLFRDFGRGRDDATAVVVRNEPWLGGSV